MLSAHILLLAYRLNLRADNEKAYKNETQYYPPVTIDDVYKEVLEQAENFKKYAE